MRAKFCCVLPLAAPAEALREPLVVAHEPQHEEGDATEDGQGEDDAAADPHASRAALAAEDFEEGLGDRAHRLHDSNARLDKEREHERDQQEQRSGKDEEDLLPDRPRVAERRNIPRPYVLWAVPLHHFCAALLLGRRGSARIRRRLPVSVAFGRVVRRTLESLLK